MYINVDGFRNLLATGLIDVNRVTARKTTLVERIIIMRNTIDGDLIKDSLRKKYSNYLLKCIQYLGEFGCDFSKTTKSRYPKHAQLNLALELALRYNDYQCVSTPGKR